MKAHRTDGVSLTFAVIFLGVTAWWLFAQLTHVTLPAIGWLVAAGLIGVGALGLVGALRANRSGRQPSTAPEAPDPGSPAAPTGDDLADPGPTDAPLGTLFDRDPLLTPDPTDRLDSDPTDRLDSDPTDRLDPDPTERLDRLSDRDTEVLPTAAGEPAEAPETAADRRDERPA
ncbi:phage holin family protein [Plantactinospora sp. BB1]|uniref:phage holin family protein n=1 Tax=Plantactinospora sp. BB1 TaxID=2071627 RepID=UPI001F1B9BF7|nr:phage holin family protein [Plantactinospora sp. BB1]